MAKTLKKFDQKLWKFSPDQVILRMNDIVDVINGMTTAIVQVDPTINSSKVLIYGKQPDNTFGIARWDKLGDQYANKVVVI